MSETELKFEEALEKLEGIVEDLESGGLNLDQSLDKFLEGVKLVKLCTSELNRAEKKIEIVLKEEEDFIETVPFSLEEEG